MPPHLLEIFLAAFLEEQPEGSVLTSGATAFVQFAKDKLAEDPIATTRVDRYGLCLVTRTGKTLRLTQPLQTPDPGPPAVPIMGQLGLGSVGLTAAAGATAIRGGR